MIIDSCPVYFFKSTGFAPSGDTVVNVAQRDKVISVYGGGGLFGEGGLSSAFGGAVVFKDDTTGQCFIGVWGTRNASRFRRELRLHLEVIIVKEAPNASLVFTKRETLQSETDSSPPK